MLSNIAKEHNDEASELRALFEKQLKEIYWAEQVMATKLGQIATCASSGDLVAALERHVVETTNHALRLESIFRVSGIVIETMVYDPVRCLIREIDDLIAFTKKGVVRDAGLISVIQKIEHYEIACYGTMRAHAIALREEDAVTLLEETLQEEKDNDILLSGIAEAHINIEAADKEI